MSKIRVGVIRGGISSEYDVSLLTGAEVLKNLPEHKYTATDIFISRDGAWHNRGIVIEPRRALEQVDVIFNALHGGYGEDGKMQSLLDGFRKQYTGSRAIPSSITLNKALTKKRLSKTSLSILMPLSILINKDEYDEDSAVEIFKTFPQPCVIKPLTYGSSIGVMFADSIESLKAGIDYAFQFSETIAVEEYISGKEITVGVIDGYRGDKNYQLFPVEVKSNNNKKICEYTDRFTKGGICMNCPSSLTSDEKENVQKLSRDIHTELGLRHYSSSDFIINSKGIYFLEVDALPSLSEHSPFSLSLREGGSELSTFIDHVITLALDDK